MQISRNPKKVELITTSREELFFVSRLLAAGLAPEVMDDEHFPLLVSIRGTLGAGKKIVSDSMREYLMGTTALSNGITGRPGYDEYWTGQIRGKDVELSYIDAAWLGGYSNNELSSFGTHMVREAFMWTRTKGGITFVQNDPSLEIMNKAGLDIWIEQQGVNNVDGPDRAPKSALAVAFKEAQLKDPENEWIRYIEVKVADTRLVDAPKFLDAFAKLKQRYGGPR